MHSSYQNMFPVSFLITFQIENETWNISIFDLAQFDQCLQRGYKGCDIPEESYQPQQCSPERLAIWSKGYFTSYSTIQIDFLE